MILFWLLALVLVGSAVFVVTAEKPVYSVVGLLLNFIALAILYLTLSAEFLAVVQILVYSGAILVLFLFVIALLSSGIGPLAVGPDRLPKIPPAIFLALVIALVAIVYGAAHTPFANSPETVAASRAVAALPVGDAAAFGGVVDFGTSLFTTNLLPFEVTAFVLMTAIIGVVLLAGDHEPLTPPSAQSLAATRRLEREAILRDGEPS